MHSIIVKDYMDANTHAISNSFDVRQVVNHLLRAGQIGAPVVDDSGNLVGYVSEQDCIKEMLNDTFFCEQAPLVTSVMSANPETITPNTSIVELAQKMVHSKRKVFPVCDQGKLVGTINRSNILRALVENDEDCYLHH